MRQSSKSKGLSVSIQSFPQVNVPLTRKSHANDEKHQSKQAAGRENRLQTDRVENRLSTVQVFVANVFASCLKRKPVTLLQHCRVGKCAFHRTPCKPIFWHFASFADSSGHKWWGADRTPLTQLKSTLTSQCADGNIVLHTLPCGAAINALSPPCSWRAIALPSKVTARTSTSITFPTCRRACGGSSGRLF
jgi:hypothetical protein